MKKVSVGLLLPSSTILPMGKDFERGVKQGLGGLTGQHGWDIEVVTELIGQGSRKNVEDAVAKMFSYHQADIITGIVSNKVVKEVAEKFEQQKVPFLVNNIGEHVPDSGKHNRYIYLNSTHTWQQIWSLSHWAVKTYGRKGMFVSGIYEAGYSFLNMMRLGMLAADRESLLDFAVAQVENGRRTADSRAVFGLIEEQDPDFVFSFFCGAEAKEFLDEYIRRGLHKTKPLLSLPFLAESFDAQGEQLEIYTSVSSYKELSGGVLNGEGATHQNPFPYLGYESGLLIAEMLKRSGGNDLTETLDMLTIDTNRGMVSPNDQPGINSRIYLVKNIHNGDKASIARHIVQELPTISYTDDAITESLNMPNSGWENPYLGI
jgi:branched-chain amino acid transport system substrate-binding protein